MKSAIGIGSLLMDGLGDTIRCVREGYMHGGLRQVGKHGCCHRAQVCSTLTEMLMA